MFLLIQVGKLRRVSIKHRFATKEDVGSGISVGPGRISLREAIHRKDIVDELSRGAFRTGFRSFYETTGAQGLSGSPRRDRKYSIFEGIMPETSRNSPSGNAAGSARRDRKYSIFEGGDYWIHYVRNKIIVINSTPKRRQQL